MNIFIVEDALFLQETLCHIFTEKGMHVTGSASSADSARAKIKVLKPDLVLMDLVLPGQKWFGSFARSSPTPSGNKSDYLHQPSL